MTGPRVPLSRSGDAGMYDPAEVRAYDRLMSRTPYRFAARRVLAEAARAGCEIPPRRILDAACGPGHLLVGLAALVPLAALHGVDISPAMLDAAERNLRRAGAGDRESLVLGSVYELPFPADTFDLVLNTNALHAFDSPASFFAEVVRVLRPNGVAVVHAYRRDVSLWLRRLGALHDRYRAREASALRFGMGALIDASYTREEVEEQIGGISSADCSVSSTFFGLSAVLRKLATPRSPL